jgi:hypothetical protein
MAKRIAVSLDPEQLNLLKRVKAFGTRDAEKVKNIVIAYLSEKGYLKDYNEGYND